MKIDKERRNYMRIKIAILDKDTSYLERLTSIFSVRYSKELEIYSFSDMKNAMTTLESKRIDVFLASDEFDVDIKNIPKRCGFAYFVEDNDTESLKNMPVVGKFQKAEQIYKQILGIFAEHSSNITGRKTDGNISEVIVFSSSVGGVGTSTLAVACAKEEAMRNRKVLYLCLEPFGISDSFFHADGNLGMSDIVFALKGKKNNLHLKLESCLKRDSSGVYFFSGTSIALDIMELSSSEIIELIEAISMTMDFDVIIIDKPFSVTADDVKIMNKANVVVMVSDGTEISNTKVKRGFNALSAMEQGMDESITMKTQIVYNKFSNKSGVVIGDIDIPVIGGFSRFVNASSTQIVDEIAKKNLFTKLFEQEKN